MAGQFLLGARLPHGNVTSTARRGRGGHNLCILECARTAIAVELGEFPVVLCPQQHDSSVVTTCDPHFLCIVHVIVCLCECVCE